MEDQQSVEMSSMNNAAALQIDAPVTIEYDDLSYTVICKEGRFFKKKTYPKTLIKNVSGYILPGKMTALMGPSGAGKSTLLDVIAGRKNQGTVEGELLFNGKPRRHDFKRMCGYVEQMDNLLPTLTPRELLYYTAKLRLPAATPEEKIQERVEQVISQLGLDVCADTVIGDGENRGISGGQAKRVNIAIELITCPSILFLDEPTSGLDSNTSYEVMKVVRGICDSGVSVVCTVHQPSTDIYELFDSLILLVDGQTVYNGSAAKAVPYFADMGFQYEEEMNPAEYLIDVVGTHSSTSDCMVKGPEREQGMFAKKWLESAHADSRKKSAKRYTSKALELAEQEEEDLFVNNQWHNLKVLVARTHKANARDPKFLVKRIITTAILGVAFLSVYWDSSKDEQGVRNRQSLLMLSMILFIFGANEFIGMLIASRVFNNRERAAASYQVSSYYFSIVLCEVPYMILKAIIWTTAIWWGVGFPFTFTSYLFMILVMFMLAEMGLGLAMLLSAISPTVEGAAALMNIFPLMFIMFSGFWIKKDSIPDPWIWAYYISYANYALSSMLINAFEGETYYYADPSGNGTYPVSGDEIIVELGVTSSGFLNNKWGNFIILVAVWFAFRLFSYIAMRKIRHDVR
eukprot:Nk52_evm28s153 gene=Nk52_evmTU28s153